MKQEVINAIDQERAYQVKKWPERPKTVGEGLIILRKLLGDAFRVWGIGGEQADEAALHEVRQLTSFGADIMERCGVRYREPQDNVQQPDMFDPKSPPDTGVKSEFDIAWPAQKLLVVDSEELRNRMPIKRCILRPDWRSYRTGPTLLGWLEEGEFAFVRVETVDHTTMAMAMTENSDLLPFYQKPFPDLTPESAVTLIRFSWVSLVAKK